MEKRDICTIQGKDYFRMTLELLAACGLAEDIGDRKKKIGIKPNLVVPAPASGGATTHPELADGLITYLKENGFGDITVMESAWVGASTMEAAQKNGILEVCRRHGVPFADMKKEPGVTCRAEGLELHVCRKALEMDYLINLPVVKGHGQTKVTCALKKGLIPDAEKRRFHALGLHRPIACLNTVLRQDFILADNICGDLDFEEGGNPVAMDRILAFKDPVLCDSFAAETMGYRPEEIEYIRLASELGVGSMDTASARIRPVRATTPALTANSPPPATLPRAGAEITTTTSARCGRRGKIRERLRPGAGWVGWQNMWSRGKPAPPVMAL